MKARKRRNGILGSKSRVTAAAVSAMIAVGTLASPATATNASAMGDRTVQDQSPVPGEYCRPWESFYGRGGKTYVSTRVCLLVDAQGNVKVKIYTQDSIWQNWLGVWNAATVGAPAYWRSDGSVSKGTSQILVYNTGDITQTRSWGSAVAPQSAPLEGCGVYDVMFNFFQRGPEHVGDEHVIDPDTRYYNKDFVIPCD
ncbi:hypothetical protein N0X72_25795 [Streptomyces carpaticus]|uniref:Secreted protein n=1 Tax=Streptomyces harbinensis TaxID=1176198 RepID=A0A1I6PB14_9ACTN|nr:hypothetical protein [Streptomyces harbinensis]UWM52156.1 hypothetical protein N0X72_25795 [Streptomyces carpaticus]SFS37359.1 hypothetical protein SAMN05444716_101390 [Streptomyces harbinensis]